jgi:D-alanyl-D-alanine carboxypeptidase
VLAAALLTIVIVQVPARSPASPVGVAGRRAVATARAAAVAPRWIRMIDTAIGNLPLSVAIGNDGDLWYRHLQGQRHAPASNEKLLLSMALFDRFGIDRTIRTRAMRAGPVRDGILHGDLWIVGRGDPEVADRDLNLLARSVAETGIRRITGSVLASTGPFTRDWWAPGWRDYFPAIYIPIPTALTFRGNEDSAGRNIGDPERRAARHLTKRLEANGVHVRRRPDMGAPPGALRAVTEIRSAPLAQIVRHMNLRSRNLWAEVLGKHLAADMYGSGSIANAGRAICAYATGAADLRATCHDASGLSYRNRISPMGILRLLWVAQDEPWGTTLRWTLPSGGQGTLRDRLADVKLRAKTGTLEDVSALSGWVWLEETGAWGEFSILSSGFSDTRAKQVENRIVRIVSARATDPSP